MAGDLTEIVRLLKERTDPVDAVQAQRVKEALQALKTLEGQLRNIAGNWNGMTNTQKQNVWLNSGDDLFVGLADTLDIVQGVIRAVVRD